MNIDFDKVINKNCLLGWRWAPMCDAVRRSPVLSDGAKILYNEIVSFIWQKDEVRAWPSQQTLGDNLSITRETACHRLKELVVVGLVGVKRNGLGKSNDIYLYNLDLNLLQVTQDDTGNFVPIPQGEVLSHETELSTKVKGLKPVVTPEVKETSHPEVKETSHLEVKETSHPEVNIAPQDLDAEGGLNPVADVISEDGDFPEEETGNIINREEESATPESNLSPSPREAKPDYLTIQRSDIPTGLIPTWNSALTEKSVVIDDKRYLIVDDDEPVNRGIETSEIDDALPNPETVEAEGGDSDTSVNREKMTKLLVDVENNLTIKADNADDGMVAACMSRDEMRAKLEEMDRRDNAALDDAARKASHALA